MAGQPFELAGDFFGFFSQLALGSPGGASLATLPGLTRPCPHALALLLLATRELAELLEGFVDRVVPSLAITTLDLLVAVA